MLVLCCKEKGHYGNEFPRRFDKKKIEIDEDIKEIINKERFILVNILEDLEMISSDKEIFI